METVQSPMPTPLVEVVPDVVRWSVWNEPRKLWFNGHLLRIGGVVVAVDPVPMTDEVVGAIEAFGRPQLCVITNKDHERAGAEVKERFGARVLVPRLDAGAMTLVGDAMDDGDAILEGLTAVVVGDGKSAGETALYWEARRMLVLGDAAVGRPAGALSMLPADKFADVAAARAGVAQLARLDVEVILVGDGEDLLGGGREALRMLGEGPAKAPAAIPGMRGC